jgi:hypothetical protein
MSTEEGEITKVLEANSDVDNTTEVLEANLGWLMPRCLLMALGSAASTMPWFTLNLNKIW